MARTSKETAPAIEEAKVEGVEATEQTAEQAVETQKESKKKDEIPAKIVDLMKLYPQYKEFYVTPEGFVHPAGVPEYLRKGATLYQNKFSDK